MPADTRQPAVGLPQKGRMTNTIPYLGKFYEFNAALMGAPVGVLVLLACLALGYAVKLIPVIENRWIPSIVIVGGVLLFPMLSDRGGELLRIWLAKTTAMGLVIASLAWLVHNKVLKRLEEKLGWFKDEAEKTP